MKYILKIIFLLLVSFFINCDSWSFTDEQMNNIVARIAIDPNDKSDFTPLPNDNEDSISEDDAYNFIIANWLTITNENALISLLENLPFSSTIQIFRAIINNKIQITPAIYMRYFYIIHTSAMLFSHKYRKIAEMLIYADNNGQTEVVKKVLLSIFDTFNPSFNDENLKSLFQAAFGDITVGGHSHGVIHISSLDLVTTFIHGDGVKLLSSVGYAYLMSLCFDYNNIELAKALLKERFRIIYNNTAEYDAAEYYRAIESFQVCYMGYVRRPTASGWPFPPVETVINEIEKSLVGAGTTTATASAATSASSASSSLTVVNSSASSASSSFSSATTSGYYLLMGTGSDF